MSSAEKRKDSYYVVSNPSAPSKDRSLVVLFAGNSQTKPGHKPGPKVVDYYLLHHVLSGRGTYTCAGQMHELGPGDTFLIEPGSLVQYTADLDAPWQYRWIAFEGTAALSLLSEAGLGSRQLIVATGRSRLVPSLFLQVQEAFQTRATGASLKAAGCLHLLLAEFAQALQQAEPGQPAAETSGARTVQQAVQYLSAQYAEPITIELMAEALGYNRAYLSTMFKAHTGVSPVTFLLSLRLDKARHLLRERPELTVEQIASSVGFQDPLHFSKQFKRRYQSSPTDYRHSVLSRRGEG
ncbi:AraC-like ligand binding domain-containing protein [Paenibacillus sp. UNCCL117]|uniref:AraC family transcriptional regulator n=1 Tax=unclassified Paenibacillus TaxID=185978 RepID=UPI000880FE95|nr:MULTISPECIES: AraC family transcriptional regulator [unclassified Paenibacillus]SDD15942.1 AraC-like ligand binding domain-containing protein [Paenibacillus sp. cl123]SFW34573.1 AraC-like ligand binding domain-containing protein [Paenibacillus sp. UNCCL117]